MVYINELTEISSHTPLLGCPSVKERRIDYAVTHLGNPLRDIRRLGRTIRQCRIEAITGMDNR